MKKHVAHIVNYEDFVRFIGSDLGDPILLEYLKYTDCHKNATYLSVNSVTDPCMRKPCCNSEIDHVTYPTSWQNNRYK